MTAGGQYSPNWSRMKDVENKMFPVDLANMTHPRSVCEIATKSLGPLLVLAQLELPPPPVMGPLPVPPRLPPHRSGCLVILGN